MPSCVALGWRPSWVSWGPIGPSCGSVLYVWYGTVQLRTTMIHTIPSHAIPYVIISYSTCPYKTIPYNTVQCHASLHTHTTQHTRCIYTYIQVCVYVYINSHAHIYIYMCNIHIHMFELSARTAYVNGQRRLQAAQAAPQTWRIAKSEAEAVKAQTRV